MKIKSYDDLAKVENNMEVDLSELNPNLQKRAIDFLNGLTCKKGALIKIACQKYLVITHLQLYSYAKQNTRMDLNNECELKEFKEEYHKFLNTLWDNIKNNKIEYKAKPGRGPYSDPDSYADNSVDKIRNNQLFYKDLCKFLSCVTGNKYEYKNEFINCGGKEFHPDQFGFSAPCTNLNHIYDKYLELTQKLGKDKDEAIEKVIKWVMESRTIGGAFIWPKTEYPKRDYNISRGGSINGGTYIEDRVDLTLLEIKHYLEGKSKENEILPKHEEETSWLDFFKELDPSKPFQKFVDTFYFNSFVDENYVPYDIVKSDFAKNELKPIKENDNKKNSIYKEDLETIERMLNNVNILINERSKQIIIRLIRDKYTLCDQ